MREYSIEVEIGSTLAWNVRENASRIDCLRDQFERGSGKRLIRLPFRIIFNELPESFCKRTLGKTQMWRERGEGRERGRKEDGDSEAEVREDAKGAKEKRGASCKEYKQCVLIRVPRPDECTIVAPGGLYTSPRRQPPRFHLCFR